MTKPVQRFNVGDKVRYTNWPELNIWIQAIIYRVIDRSRWGKCAQYLLLHYVDGEKDYGPYRSTVSDETPTLQLDPNPPVAKSIWEKT